MTFPTRPPADVHPDDVVPYLQELEVQGWPIYTEPDGFSIQTTETNLLRLSFNAMYRTCSFHGSSSDSGVTSSGPTARNIGEVAAYLRKTTGGAPPATNVRLSRNEPAHNVIRASTLIRYAKAKVEAVYDGWLDDVGMATFSSLVRLSRAVSPGVRLLTSRQQGAKNLNPRWAIQLLRELGCQQAEIRQMSVKGHEGRFLLLSGGRTLRMGMSLNSFDCNDAAHLDVEGDREDRALFQSAWDNSEPI